MVKVAKISILSIVAITFLMGCSAVNNYILKQQAASILNPPKLIDYAKDRKRYF